MTSALAALHDPAWQQLGVALIHFVWQGLLIAAAYQLWVELFRVRRAESRYLGGLVALSLMAVCPLLTWSVVDVRHDLLSPSQHDLLTASPGLHDPLSGPSDYTVAVAISWVVAAWLVGVAVLGARVLAGLLSVCWVTRRGADAPDAWRTRIADLCRLIGLRTVPRTVVTTEVHDALAAGFFRPFIVLPSAWLLELPPDMVEAVLAHELAHIRRWDLWVNLAQRVVESLLFYHPAVWWLSRTIRIQREMCCDELAVNATQQRVTYASALETLARRSLRPQLSPLTIGMGGVRMALLERVRNVLGTGAAARGALWWPAAVLLIGISLALWMTSDRGPAPVNAADRDQSAAVDDGSPDEYTDPRDEDRSRGRSARYAPPPRRGPPRDDGPPREGDHRGPPDGRRPDPNRSPPAELRPGDRPESEREAELMQAIRDLHDEVAELRRDVREIRDRRPPPLPPALRALIESLPRDEFGRPKWGPIGPPPGGHLPPEDRRPEDGRVEAGPEGQPAESREPARSAD